MKEGWENKFFQGLSRSSGQVYEADDVYGNEPKIKELRLETKAGVDQVVQKISAPNRVGRLIYEISAFEYKESLSEK